METSEVYFLKYAFPCAGVLRDKGDISEERYLELESAFRMKRGLERSLLEETFPAAFRRIRNLAQKMGKEPFDIEVIEEYWLRDHNKIIDEGEGNYSKFPNWFKDYCKVHEAEVIGKLKAGFVRVRYNGVERNVQGELISDLGVGDVVRIHHAYAVERVE
jgi:hypothetical protein